MAEKKKYHHGDLAQALLIAAEAELIENGVERFSLRAVAKRAGVSHGAPAHHFGDARGLLTALAANGYERLHDMQIAYENVADATPESQHSASGLGYIRFAMQNPELFYIMFNSGMPDRENERFAAISLAVFERLVRRIEKITSKNPYNDEQSRLDLMTSWSAVHGLAELIISGRAERVLGLSKLPEETCDDIITSILKRVTPPQRN